MSAAALEDVFFKKNVSKLMGKVVAGFAKKY